MIKGQLNEKEREILTNCILEQKPKVVLEVGTWLGGGSTLHILKALSENGHGHLWGIEANEEIYEKMIENISSLGSDAVSRFTPLFGFSDDVIPSFSSKNTDPIEVVFLDGGDNPMEQILEFQLLSDSIPVGGVLFSHDAKLRKGKWLVPYLQKLDNWDCTLHDVSAEGLFEARKIAIEPSEKSQIDANISLQRLKRDIIERMGAIIPSNMNRVIAKFLPKSVLFKITQGRG